ncbi:MAG: pseudouridine synthase [Gemmatimonadota bacterium]
MTEVEGGMRLQKFLSRAGVASRREAETLMLRGRVRVNGEPAVTPGIRVDPGRDRVEVDGREVRLVAKRWLMLHKPRGVLTTRRDPRGRPTVYSLLPPDSSDLRYVGRLDRNTEGLLLLSNDGDVVHGLLHPSSEVPREYHALVVGEPTRETLARLQSGVQLEDGPAKAEKVKILRSGRERERSLVRMVLREGRKREVRRMLEAVGHPVRGLRRVRFGPVGLGDLPRGEWRELTEREVSDLRRAATPPPRRGGRSGTP